MTSAIAVFCVLTVMTSGVGGTGLWTKCVGAPPDDAFLDPFNHNAPAWTDEYYGAIGRGEPREGDCQAWFPDWYNQEAKLGSNQFYFLR